MNKAEFCFYKESAGPERPVLSLKFPANYFFISFLNSDGLSPHSFLNTLEKQAIIEVIEGEHVAAASKDFNKFAGYYDQNENVIWGNAITYSYKGWAEVGKTIKSLMEQDPEPMDPSVFYDYQISIAGNKAWATFDKKEKGGSHPISKEQRILIKKNGEWKLVTALFFPM